MAREPKDPSRLLEGLESIRSALSSEPTTRTEWSTSAQDIPLLDDIIRSGQDRPTDGSPPSLGHSSDKTAQNPFLPYESLARLAGERVHLDRLLNEQLKPTRRTRPSVSAREVRLEARLHDEAQLLLQEVIDEFLPVIEAQLRKRLTDKLDQLVSEQR